MKRKVLFKQKNPDKNSENCGNCENRENRNKTASPFLTASPLSTVSYRFPLLPLFFLLVLLCCFAAPHRTQAQNTIAFTPQSLPAAIIPQGDAVNFGMTITNTVNAAQPAGWKLKVFLSSSNWYINSATSGSALADVRSGDTVTFTLPAIPAMGAISVQINVSPKCGIIGGADKIYFTVYDAANNRKSDLNYDAYPGGIANVLPPILSFTPQGSTIVRLNIDALRTHNITQTELLSYAKQMKIVHAADTNVIKLKLLEVSTNNSTWITVVDSLITRTVSGYTYNFNALLLHQLGYSNDRLNGSEAIYFRETVQLTTCTGSNISTYTNYYGADGIFCATTTGGVAQLSTGSPSYTPNVRTISYTVPDRNGNKEGIVKIRALNSSTDPNAVMADIKIPVYNTGSRDGKSGMAFYKNTKAYLIHPTTGNLITGAGGATDTIFVPMYNNRGFASINDGTIANDANTYVIILDSLDAATNAKIAYAISTLGDNVVGLFDFDGDGKYNDLKPGKEVAIAIQFVPDLSTVTNCASTFRGSTIRIAYLAWKNNCNQIQMFHQDYTTNSANQASQVWVARFFYTALTDAKTIPANIRVGDQVRLQISEGINSGSSNSGDFVQNNAWYEHFVELTLPEGFELPSPIPSNAIQINRGTQAYPTTIEHTVNPAYITYNPLTRVIRFQYVGYTYWYAEQQHFYVLVDVLPSIVTSTNKNAYIRHIFRYGDEPTTEYPYSCSNVTSKYNLMETCPDFVFDDYTIRRQNFGFRSNTDLTPIAGEADAISRNLNVECAFPYDIVHIKAKAHVTTAITQSSTNQLRAAFSYVGINATRYFDFRSNEVEVIVKRGGSNYVYAIPDGNVSYAYQNVAGVGHTHTITVNCQPAGNFQIGDSVFLTMPILARGDLPQTYPAIPNLKLQWAIAAGGVMPANCNILQNSNFLIRNYRMSAIVNPSNGRTYNIGKIGTDNSYMVGIYCTPNTSANFQIGGVEYRPPYQTISDSAVLVMNGLLKFNYITDQIPSFLTNITLVPNVDYTVTYNNNQTIVTFLTPKARYFGYTTMTYAYTDYHYFDWQYIWYAGNTNMTYTARILDFPTSSDPQERTISYTSNLSRLVTNFNYNLSSPQSLAEPASNRATWALTVTNLSAWGESLINDTLYHSWIAFEDESQSLYDPILKHNLSGATYSPLTYTSMDGTKTYYWFKIGNLKASAEDFTLSARYNSCSSRIDFTAKYSCGRADYPFDPIRGFAQYNSPTAKNMEKTVTLSLLPPQGAVSGTLAVSTTPVTPPNYYDICPPICYTATVRSGMNAYLYNPIVIVRKGDGMTWDGNMATVSATYKGVPVSGVIDVIETADSIIFILPNTVEIEGVSAGGGDLAVNFCLSMGNGFISNTPTYAYLTAETGCGMRYSFLANSANVRVNGFPANMPIFNMYDFEASDLTYSSNGEGSMTLTGTYTIIANPSQGTSSFIILPENLRLVSGTLTAGSYSSNYITTRDRRIIRAPFSDDPALLNTGIEYTVNLILQATSPGNWSCKTDTIITTSGLSMQFFCPAPKGTINVTEMSDISTIQEFTVKKIELDFRTAATTVVGEYYSPTQEKVTITPTLLNNSATGSGAIKIELFLDNDGDGTLSFGDGAVLGNPYIGIPNIGGYNEESVSRSFILNSTDVCKLMLVIRQENNPYICNTIVYKPPIKDFALPKNNFEICQGSAENIGIETMTDYTYSWSPNTYLSATNIANPVFNYPIGIVSPEQLVYYITIMRPDSCTITKRVDVTVNPLPHLSNSLILDTICSGSVAYSSITTNTPGDVQFSWFRPSVIGINGNAASIGTGIILLDVLNNSTSTLKTVKYIYTSFVNGCSAKDTLTINVYGQTTIGNLATPLAICNGGTITATVPNIQVGGATVLSQGWKLDGENFLLSMPLTVTDNGKRLKYVMMTTCGEFSSNEVVITVNPYPTITSLKTNSICSGEAFSYNLTSGVSGVGFTWERLNHLNINNNDGGRVGSGAVINEVLTSNTNTTVTVKYVVKMSANNCNSVDTVFVNVKPMPSLSSSLTETQCSGATFAYTPTSLVSGTSFAWERLDNPAIMEPGNSGIGNVPNTVLTNISVAPTTVQYIYTLSAQGCVNEQIVRVVVQPRPTLSSTLTPAAICSGNTFNYTARSATSGISFSWSRANVAGITPATGSGSSGSISEVLTNGNTYPVTVKYVVTMSMNTPPACACADTVEVVVNPIPKIEVQTINPICSDDYFVYNITSLTQNTNFTWRRLPNTNIRQAVTNGVTSLISEQLSINDGISTDQTVQYTIASEANGCHNTGETISVLVRPLPTLNVLPSTVNMAAGDIIQLTATSNAPAANISWVSSNTGVATVAPTSGNLTTTLTAIAQGTIYVTAKINAVPPPTGGCERSQQVLVNVGPANVAALSLTSGYPSEICTGGSTRLNIAISGGEAPFKVKYKYRTIGVGTWTYVTLTNLASTTNFTVAPTNSTTSVIQVEYAIDSVWTHNNQLVTPLPSTVIIEVSPAATVTNIPAQTVCEGSILNTVPAFTSNVTGATFEWQNHNPAINLSLSGTGNLPAFIAQNGSGAPMNATVEVRAVTVNGSATCPGTWNSFVITVNPKPTFNTVNPDPICQGDPVTLTQSAHTANINPSVGTTIKFYTDLACTSEITAAVSPTTTTTYYAKATTAENCASTVQPIVVTVKPKPLLSSPIAASVCSGEPFEYVATSNITNGVSFSWGNTMPALGEIITPASAGMGATIRDVFNINPLMLDLAPFIVEYDITVTADGCSTTTSVNVTVNATPTMGTLPTDEAICSGETFSFDLTSRIAPASAMWRWERLYANGIDEVETSGNNTDINEILTNSNPTPVVVKYQLNSNTSVGCSSAQELRVTVAPSPTLTSTLYPTPICSGSQFNYTARSRTPNTIFSWQRLNNANISGSSGAADVWHNGNIISETVMSTAATQQSVEYEIRMRYALNATDTCENIEVIELIVNPTPALTSSLAPDTICSGNYFSYTLTSGTPNVNYMWNRPRVNGISQQMGFGSTPYIAEMLTNTTAAPVTVTYNFTLEANGCSRTGLSKPVVVNPVPQVTITNASPVMMSVGGVTTLHAVTPTTTTISSWAWQSSNLSLVDIIGGIATPNADIKAINEGTATLSVTAENALGGCPGIASILVNVGAAPTATLSLATGAPREICNNGSTMLKVDIINGTPPFRVIYTNDIDNDHDTVFVYGTTADFEVYPPANTGTGQMTVTYTLVDVGYGTNFTMPVGTSASVGIPIRVNPTATVATVLTDVTVCQGGVVSGRPFTSPSDPKVSYAWTNDNPNIGLAVSGIGAMPSFIAQNPLGAQTTADITVTPSYRGTIVCVGRDTTFQIIVNPKPEFNVINPPAICVGDSVLLSTFFSTIQNLTPAGSTVRLYVDYGCTLGFWHMPFMAPPMTNTYYARAQSAPAGCLSDVKEITVTVKPRPVMTSSATETICSGDRLEYTISTDMSSGITYHWERIAHADINSNNTSSGNNSTIREQLINNSTSPVVVKYSITMTAQGCPTTDTLKVTVNPKPTLDIATISPICSGDMFNYVNSSTVSGANFSWERVDIAGILEAPTMGTGDIHEILTNTTPNPIQVSYLVTVEKNGCSTTQQIRVTVNPLPVLSSSLENRAICSGSTFTYNITSSTRGATFTWRRAAVGGNLAATGLNSNVISEPLTNTTNADITAVYVITTTFASCSTNDTLLVTVYPQVKITSPLLPPDICSEDYFTYTITSNIANANFTWRRHANPNIQQPISSGSAEDIYEQLTIRNSTSAVTVTYLVRAEANGCMSAQEEVKVKVNPKPTVRMITPTPLQMAVGNIVTVTATTNGTVLRWESSNNSVATVAALAAPADTQAVITAISQGIAQITLVVENPVTHCENEVTFIVNVEAAHTAVLTLASNGSSEICSEGVTMLEVTINGGRPPFTVIYTETDTLGGTTTTTSHTLTNVGASVHRFMVHPPANTGNSPMTVTYELDTVIESGPQGVHRIRTTVDITVNPVPTVTTVFASPYIYCEGDLVSNLPAFTSDATPTNRVSYQWQNSNPAIGLAMSGTTSRIANFIAANGQGVQVSSDITVTPYYRGLFVTCQGIDSTFQIKVNPKPDFMVVNPDPICRGEAYNFPDSAINLIQNIIPTGSTIHFYTDRACTNEILGEVSPTVTTTYFVRLTSDSPAECNSAVKEIVLTIKPLPRLTSAKLVTICSGEPFDYEATSDLSGVSFEWTRDAVTGITPTNTTGYGYRIRETLTNLLNTPVTVIYSITMTANGCNLTDTVKVTVNPKPVLNNVPTLTDRTICSGSAFVYNAPTSNVSTATINWTRLDNPQIVEPGRSGTGAIDDTLTNLGTSPVTVTYEFMLTYLGCTQTELVRVIVNPVPVLSSRLDAGEICSESTFIYTARSETRGTTFTWERIDVAGITPLSLGVTTGASISEQLTNNSTNPIIVSYKVTMTANGCSNLETVEVVVNPIPQLDPSTLQQYYICSGDAFIFELQSLTPNTTYSWFRIPNVQIVEAPSYSNSIIISEILTNRTDSVAHVAYRVITEANGCRNSGDTVKVDVNTMPAVAITSPTPVHVTVNNNRPASASIAPDCIAVWSSANASVATVIADGTDQTLATVHGVARGITEGIITITDTITGCSNSATFVINVEAEQVAQLQVPQGFVPQICTGDSTMLEIWLSGGDIPFAFEYNDGATTFYDTAYTSIYRFYVNPQINTTNSPITTTYTLTSVTDGVNQTLTIVGRPIVITTNPIAVVSNIALLSDTICEGSLVSIPAFETNVTPANRVRFQWENDNPSIGLGLSGNTNLPRFVAANSFGTVQEGIVTVHPIYVDLISCPGTDTNFTIMVEPTPEFVVVHPDPICYGSEFDLNGNVDDIIQGVIPAGSTIEFFTDRNCDIDSLITAPVTPLGTTRYFVKVTSDFGCESDVQDVIITVNPIPDVDSLLQYMICNNEGVNIHFSGSMPYTQFRWYKSGTINTNITGLAANGYNFIEALSLSNTTTDVQEQEITVVPELNSGGASCMLICSHAEHITCEGDSITFKIIVNPTPVLTSLLVNTICSGTEFDYTLTSATPDVTFRWEREANSDILEVPIRGDNATIFDTLTNLTQRTVQVRYRVTLDTNGCTNVQYVMVNVKPTPVLTSPLDGGEICSGTNFNYTPTSAVTGATFNWVRHTAFGIEETIAPLALGVTSITDRLTNNTPTEPVIVEYYVTSIANGCSNTQTVRVLVAPKPTVETIADQEICHGSLSEAVYFDGVATGYKWFIDQNIGLPLRGEGNLPSAIVSHNQDTAVDATVSVVPLYAISNAICTGDTGTFVITVNPLPKVNPIANIVVCHDATVSVPISGAASTKFVCTTLTDIGMADSVTVNAGDNLTFTAQDTTNAPVTAIITVLPVYETAAQECYGETITFAITVNPIPAVHATEDVTVCEGTPVSAIQFSGDVVGAVYTWTHIDGAAITGLPTTGVNQIPPFIATNLTDTTLTAIYEVVAAYTFGGVTCSHNRDTFAIRIYPKPFVEPILDYEYCAQATTTPIVFAGNTSLNTYDWRIVTGPNIGLPNTFGTGLEIPSFVTVNTNSYMRTSQFEVIPRIDGTSCVGNPIYFNIVVNPVAVLSSALHNDTICAGEWFDYTATSVSQNVFFRWTRPAIGGMNELTSQGAIIHERLHNNTDEPIRVEYIITLSFEGCDNDDTTSIMVKPTPVVLLDSAYYHACEGDVVVNLTYTIDRPNLPLKYKLVFEDPARAVGFLNTVYQPVTTSGIITVNVPANVPHGSYMGTLFIESLGCPAPENYPFVIVVAPATKITKQPEAEVMMCEGYGSLHLEVTAEGENVTYQWYHNGAAIAGATHSAYQVNKPTADDYGQYFVVVNGACGSDTSIIINVVPNVAVIYQKWDDVLFVSGMDSLGQNLQFAYFQWYKLNESTGKFLPIFRSADAQYYQDPNGVNGTYMVEIFYVNGTSFTSCPYTFIPPAPSKNLQLYPNPVQYGDMFHIQLDEKATADDLSKMSVEVMTTKGQLLEKIVPDSHVIDIRMKLPAAVYIIKVTMANGEVTINKLIVN